MKDYAVIFGRTPTGWSAHVPDLPGLAAVGDTYDETFQLMQEALDFHLKSMREDGDPIPEPTTRVSMVSVEAFEQRFAKSA